MKISSISVGAGVGVRLDWPLGRARMDVGFPVTRRYAEGPQLYLGTGTAF